MNVHTLICYGTEGLGAGGHELYPVVNGNRIWSSADSVDCDHGSPDLDDLLGSGAIEGSSGTLTFNNDGAPYELDCGPA